MRSIIIKLARKQEPSLGDNAMIVEGEWSYCVACDIYVQKKSVESEIERIKKGTHDHHTIDGSPIQGC